MKNEFVEWNYYLLYKCHGCFVGLFILDNCGGSRVCLFTEMSTASCPVFVVFSFSAGVRKHCFTIQLCNVQNYTHIVKPRRLVKLLLVTPQIVRTLTLVRLIFSSQDALHSHYMVLPQTFLYSIYR